MTSSVLGIADDTALGGSVRVIVTRPAELSAAKAAVDRVLEDIDRAASRFRDDSELSRLNATPDQDVVIGRLLARALSAALRGARSTGGAVDPTIGSALRLAGYDGDFAQIPTDGPAIKLVFTRTPGWNAIRFDETRRTVRIPRGVEIDLGATAKALAADLAATAATEATTGGGVLVSLGGDISVAGEPPREGWLIQTSEDSGAPIDDKEETVSIRSGGIATSSMTVRRWIRGGAVLHHIIDPATGLPASGPWRTASVVAASCVDANIASTAAIVMGERAVAWLEANGLQSRLVDRDGNVHRVSGWPLPEPVQDSNPKHLLNDF
jgi:thiamine biosynthesis lipoprotein ApbE